MTDDLSREAMTMVERDGGAHQRIMPHEQSDYTLYTLNLTIPVLLLISRVLRVARLVILSALICNFDQCAKRNRAPTLKW